MLEEIKALSAQIKSDLSAISTPEELEAFRLKHLVRKGTIAQLFDRMREVSKEDKPLVGKEMNILRTTAQSGFDELQSGVSKKEAKPSEDLTLPPRTLYHGHEHPIMQAKARMEEIFIRMGFTIATGPDIEDDYHNFEALNFPPDHPARDMQDTFFVKHGDREDVVLRTHTSPVQIRMMQSHEPPIRAIMPGRVYRNESITARSLAEFYQVEGLYVDKGVTMAQLKGTLFEFAKAYYGEDIKFRFRPSFFPFTEPSAEMDITCFLCDGQGCRVCKQSGWLEILGCGMVHPNVLSNCGIDPEVYSGYAFGMGIERTQMLAIGLDDIRLFYENDMRFLGQF
ncbi:MAG: phenylalanine--tRNA ligase subunit alpha [Ignavibacteriae bacterium]|nr:phenylalanine--tRNA ligase subunit alpha [Ignavibacteriota bacterium]MCB9215372.1 phenylalanine--tRNA ligase subunit alpha [Ignavibacteria bacterium]